MNSNKPIISAQNLKKYYPIKKGILSNRIIGTIKAVDDVSLCIYEGEVLGLVGESGCGKSTLSRLLIRLTSPTFGDVWFDGNKISEKNIQTFRKNMAMIFQDPYSSLDPRMKVEDIIGEPLRVHTNLNKRQRRELVIKILDKVGLPKDSLNQYPHEFSGGQRQRIGIARALIMNPKFIICDEPVSSLDMSIQATILNLLANMRREYKLSYLFISHDMSVVRHMSDRIAIMYMGKIVEIASRDELFNHTLHPYSIALINAIPVPYPIAGKKRILLTGDIPSPINPPDGCVFQTRCNKVMQICRNNAPVLSEVFPHHFVSCHLMSTGIIL